MKRLASEYDGTYDRKKFAATIQLLNFNTDPVFQTSIQATSDAALQSHFGMVTTRLSVLWQIWVSREQMISPSLAILM